MRKIKLLGVACQLQDIKGLLKKKQVEIALSFLDATIDYIDIHHEVVSEH